MINTAIARNCFRKLALTSLTAALIGLTVLGVAPAHSATYFVASGADGSGSGSQQAPWSSLNQALGSGQINGGDKIVLRAGKYGRVKIRDARFNAPVTITSAENSVVHFEQIEISSSRNIVLNGLAVWPLRTSNLPTYLVRAYRDSADIVFQDMDIRGAEDAAQYRRWSKSKWLANQVNGILAEGPRNIISNSNLSGVYHALGVSGDGGKLINNRVLGYSGDGARALGDNSLVRGNIFQDCVKIDGNHDDAFMTWSLGPGNKVGGGTIRNLVIENNLIEEWTGPKNHPLICELQGIFLGGYLDDLVIRNNVVSVSAYHGISAYGVTRGLIANNTLVNSRGPSRTQPWIGIWGHGERGSRQVTVVNNIAPLYKVNAEPGSAPRDFRNVVLIYPAQQLRAPARGDFRPKSDSTLIDGGNSRLAPGEDIDGVQRPLGGAVDIGAYEVR